MTELTPNSNFNISGQIRSNPLMEKIKFPGKVLDIPSKALLYKNEVNKTNNPGEIQVKPLSALAEIKLKTADLLYTGQAFVEVIKESCPDILDPIQLFAKDIDAIMAVIRQVSYGDEFEISVAHGCDNVERTYSVNLSNFLDKVTYLTEEVIEKNYTIVLDNGQKVVLEPIRLKHVVDTYQLVIMENTRETPYNQSELENIMVSNLLAMINNIDGITDKTDVKEWVSKAPSRYINKVTKQIEIANNSWGVDFKSKCQCKKCGEVFEVDVPINPITFFSE